MTSFASLDVTDALLDFALRALAKAETSTGRRNRDMLQQAWLAEMVADLRQYFVDMANRMGIPFDPDDVDVPKTNRPMVNPAPAPGPLGKRGTFVGFPRKPPFDLRFDWDNEADELAKVMKPHYERFLNGGVKQSAADLAAVNADISRLSGIAGALDLGDYDTSIRDALANRIVRVNEATKASVRKVIERGVQQGLSTKNIANGVEGFPGIRGLVAQSYKNRSRVIALTETANAYNLGQLEGYIESNVVEKVRIFDGSDCGWTSHNDPDKANGSTRTLAAARAHPTSHPNCQRSWAPVPVGQTKGTGATRQPKTGTPRTTAPKPPVQTPTPQTPPTTAVGQRGSRWANADFADVEQHILPPGHTFEGAGVVLKPDGFRTTLSRLPMDKATQRRFTEVMQQRYGIRDVRFTPKTKALYNVDDALGVVDGFEDYRRLGVGLDDLELTWTAKSPPHPLVRGAKVPAHFDTQVGAAGEIQIHKPMAGAGRERLQNMMRHELGHAVDNRVMGHAGGNGKPLWLRASTNADLRDDWAALHSASRSSTNPDIARQNARVLRTKISRLDDDIVDLQRSVSTASDDLTRGSAERGLASRRALRSGYQKQLQALDDAATDGVESFVTKYASNNPAEDFAESMREYLKNRVAFRAAHPKRAQMVERALERAKQLPTAYADDVPPPPAIQARQQFEAAKKARAATRRREIREAKAAAKARRDAAAAAERKAEADAARAAQEAREARAAAARAARAADETGGYKPARTSGVNDPKWEAENLRTAYGKYAEKFATESVKRPDGTTFHVVPGDRVQGAMNTLTGADGPALLVDSVDDLLANGWRELYRGVGGVKSGTSHAAKYQSGDFFPGRGIFGNGTYTAEVRAEGVVALGRKRAISIASGYADDSGEIMRIALHPNAKIGDFAILEKEMNAHVAQIARTRSAAGLPPDIPDAFTDVGRYALSRGYDAVRVSDAAGNGNHFMVVLNRTATAVEKATIQPKFFDA